MVLIRYNVAISLDGFIASSDHTTSWIVEDSTIDFDALYSIFSTFVMGRRTYETMLSYGDNNPLRSKSQDEMIVISRTMKQEEYPNVTVVKDDVVGFVKALKSKNEDEGRKDIWLFGGGRLAGLLMDAGLVDRVEVAVMPVLLGDGVMMIDGSGWGGTNMKLKTASVSKLDSGIVMCVYDVDKSRTSMQKTGNNFD